MSDLSDEEAPTEVTFNDSKETALKSVKDARESVRREKELLKEKRRKKQLLFQEQKKNRLLPETLLEQLEALAERLPATSEENGKKEEKKQQKEEKKKVRKRKSVSKSLQGNCSVMRVKDKSSLTPMQKSAMDFMQTRLYGPGNLRTSNAELLSLEKKRGLDQGASVQFADKHWGADQKAKAAKCNKRFINRHKLISS